MLERAVLEMYRMMQNNEPWDLGDPKLNDQGHPDVYDIVCKVGCKIVSKAGYIQPSLQAPPGMGTEDTGSRMLSGSSPSSLSLAYTVRASSTESDHSVMRAQQQQTGASVEPPRLNTVLAKSSPLTLQQRNSEGDASYSSTISTNTPVPSLSYRDFQIPSSTFCKEFPFPSWSANNDSLLQQYLESNVLNFSDGTTSMVDDGYPSDPGFTHLLGLCGSSPTSSEFDYTVGTLGSNLGLLNPTPY